MTLANLQRDDFDGLGKLTRDHGVVPDLEGIVQDLAQRGGEYLKAAADGAAADATAETPFHAVVTKSQTVQSVQYTPAAALTSNDTNFATLQVRLRNADGSDGGLVASETTETAPTGGSGNWTAFLAVSIPLLAGATLLLTDGESLTFEITKAAAGVVVPAGSLKVSYK